jgi:hypothetical protein
MSEAASETVNNPVVQRLDRLTTLLELALAPQLEEARQKIRSDGLDAAIFDAAAGGWTPASQLRQAVAAATGRKQRAIQIHVGDLVDKGFLLKRGGGNHVEYFTSEVI